MILAGKSLGDRQRELNIKVKEATLQNVNFDSIKVEAERTDIDKLFKIDLASKLKNLDYIVDVLKSGDSLYISRALKCVWLYEDEYSGIINTDYLHNKIFPFMSAKMKKKMMTVISMYLNNQSRAATFYLYCKDNKMINNASKFIISTSESFKLEMIKNNIDTLNSVLKIKYFNKIIEKRNLRCFIGTSFLLADAYLNEFSESKKNIALYELRYLYSVNDTKYLETLEKHVCLADIRHVNRLGLRITKNIMNKYKDRTIQHPLPYVSLLNKNVFVKYITSNDAKMYLAGLLPIDPSHFWSMNYNERFEYIIDLVPSEEKYEFLKSIFTNKYPWQPFEMDDRFYFQAYYKYMTVEERETWALRNLASRKQIGGSGPIYCWYKFVNFDKAFVEIKKILLTTTDARTKMEMFEVLIESAKNQRDVEKLLNYYNEAHVKVNRDDKENFLKKLYKNHKVFEFDNYCWLAYNNLLHSLEVYNVDYENFNNDYHYRMIALVYHLINNIEIPEAIKEFGIIIGSLEVYTSSLTNEKRDVVFRHVLQIEVDYYNTLETVTYNDDVKFKLRNRIRYTQRVLALWKKSEEEYPEIVKKYMRLDPETFYPKIKEKPKKLSEGHLLRLLKQDSSLVVDYLPLIQQNSEDKSFRLNLLYKKLRVYFQNGVAQDYLQFFIKLLTNPESTQSVYFMAVYGIFQLADDKFKHDFVAKYEPTEAKILHNEINRSLLYIQESICRFVCYSRPPVALSNVVAYIKGDYLHYCLPMFNAYFVSLPPTLYEEFVEAVLNKPVSVQKHGLRLAFKSFRTPDLKKLMLRVWKRSKNVSLRTIVYTSLFKYILQKDGMTQIELFQVLKTFTLDLHENDHDDVINLLTDDEIPHNFKGEYLIAGWQSVSKFSNNEDNLTRKCDVISAIAKNLHCIDKDAVKTIIDEYIRELFIEKEILGMIDRYEYRRGLDSDKMKLIETYICKYNNDSQTLDLVKFITNSCLEMWDYVGEDWQACKTYTIRQFYFDFVFGLLNIPYHGETVNIIYEYILQELHKALPLYEIYIIVWKLKIAILTNKIINKGTNKMDKVSEVQNMVLVIKDISNDFASGINIIINEFIEKQIFDKSFIQSIKDIVKYSLRYILVVPALDSYKHGLHLDSVRVYVSAGLAKFKSLEAVLLATSILPRNGSETAHSEYLELISTFIDFPNSEVQCLAYQKFVDSNYRETCLNKRIKIS